MCGIACFMCASLFVVVLYVYIHVLSRVWCAGVCECSCVLLCMWVVASMCLCVLFVSVWYCMFYVC